jgi:hypothetical protein
MKKYYLYDYIVETADKALGLIDCQRGSLPPGENGPHKHPETPVRNSSHWLITFSKAFEITKEKKYLRAVEKISTFI